MRKSFPVTPDGRYFVAKGRLWRCTDPALDEQTRQRAVSELMSARRAVRDANDETRERAARHRVQAAKETLGERGPVWWDDDAPDETGYAPANTRYASWWAQCTPAERRAGTA